ncbi:Sulfotransferase family protein [Duganella sp. CF517]|uniref:aspartyl/asparaginyl beta-hydroxylase domain-containing protein n=1 Tax=Duganella sp. CF517 TaxID=1881038 RepID=UPI0008BDCF26|nr:aspartyl/asparaginyl beta-hydroxylase domain-containing protein [Duganella sp. CF517]SEN49310.1 Sulfotransferase family protein [Duganella sp. CF517]
MTPASARYLKLPLSFDAARLQAELDALLAPQWVEHFNTRDYDGGWRCLALRSADGRPRDIGALSEANFLDTPALAQCPYLRAVLDTFECDKAAVRLMAQEAGAVIKPHRDAATAFDDGLARLHVPLQTDPAVTFCIDGEDIHFSRGDTWYLNAGRTHAVHNRSARSRIHLVLDCLVNPWLRQLFARAGMAPSAPPRFGQVGADDKHPLAHQRRALLRAPEITLAQAGSLEGWYPVAVGDQPEGLWWRRLGARPFSEPFFSDTFRHQPPAERQLCFSDWQAPAALPDALAPNAFIFHVSRCGSTLLTQMLATLPSCVALSEPPVVDDFLRLRRQRLDAAGTDDVADHASHAGDAGDIVRLRALVRALGQRRDPRQRHLVVKLDSWHLRDLALLRAAFPATAMVFLYREPLQVLASHQRQRGPQMLPGLIDPDWLGITFDPPGEAGVAAGKTEADHGAGERLAPSDLDRYCLHVLCTLMETALATQNRGQPLLLLNYADLPKLPGLPLLARLGIRPGRTERADMLRRAAFHAKHGAPFSGDAATAGRWGAAPGPALFDRLARLYAALEQSRLNNEFVGN